MWDGYHRRVPVLDHHLAARREAQVGYTGEAVEAVLGDLGVAGKQERDRYWDEHCSWRGGCPRLTCTHMILCKSIAAVI